MGLSKSFGRGPCAVIFFVSPWAFEHRSKASVPEHTERRCVIRPCAMLKRRVIGRRVYINVHAFVRRDWAGLRGMELTLT